MKYLVKAPKEIKDNIIQLTASKSISNRALIVNALSSHKVDLINLAKCSDTNVLVKALNSKDEVIDIGDCGTAMRFLVAYFAVKDGETHILTGTDRMKHRPIGNLVDALKSLGADIEYLGSEGYPPLKIVGKKLDGGIVEINGNVSSQFISALMMIGPTMKNGLRIKIKGEMVSSSYAKLTHQVMNDFGVLTYYDDHYISILNSEYHRYNDFYIIDNDWSSASYWYETMALGKSLLQKMYIKMGNDTTWCIQPDKYMSELSEYFFGIDTNDCKGEYIQLVNKRDISDGKLTLDFCTYPDIVQTIVCVCIGLDMPFEFSGLDTLRIKETDRIDALIMECKKLGYVLYEDDKGHLCWDGEKTDIDKNVVINTYNDHRMAMAFAPLAIKFEEITIDNPGVVKKSYPSYWDDLKRFGFGICEI